MIDKYYYLNSDEQKKSDRGVVHGYSRADLKVFTLTKVSIGDRSICAHGHSSTDGNLGVFNSVIVPKDSASPSTDLGVLHSIIGLRHVGLTSGAARLRLISGGSRSLLIGR